MLRGIIREVTTRTPHLQSYEDEDFKIFYLLFNTLYKLSNFFTIKASYFYNKFDRSSFFYHLKCDFSSCLVFPLYPPRLSTFFFSLFLPRHWSLHILFLHIHFLYFHH